MSMQNKITVDSNRAGKNGGYKTGAGQRKMSVVSRNRYVYRFYIIFLLWGACTLFYYFGELVEFAGWEALHWPLLYSVHDIHRLVFLAPIIYTAYVFGVRAVMIVTIVTIMTFIPRALFVSPFPDPLLRMAVFSIIAGIIGYLTATTRRESERSRRMANMLRSERDTMLGMLERMEDGIMIIGPDYRIRFMNTKIIGDFGEGTGSHCYECLHKLDAPCPQICKLPEVINGEIERWEYSFPDGRTYEVMASPYIDSDETVCQLTAFRKIR